ncbi:MAG TPA: chemotaxis protein CheW [Gemmatimonadaceae bacterium]|jgi:purine-binding chemotaxis protein CheW|nr:chemotaxis protein CheW [Gemmatimonadaceae bacterium]
MTAATAQQLVIFRLGEDQFAVDIFAVERVLRYSAPAIVPNLPSWIDGVIEHGERVVPLIDLRTRFGMPRLSPRPEHRILVLAIGEDLLGVTVDSVHEVMSVAPEDIAAPPPLFRGLNADYLRGLVYGEGSLIIFLDMARVLTSSELLELTQATASNG